ncbi:DUF58 domain-containing protein [Alicyclobacillus fastidiosus]|uniref:DUF58 domain-containing protein n=1 Tax=Alicyclobacillus fastidiosus TaxID=392011 RepID=A0ABY6ZBF8_9BACL|nr:DUF58 domain-containing protein [Alicyclobacillus fastidiosus]WAH39877.1 DUF58 domain-containing protein [Alicyclobacillus fastidiosus]GMA61146.1 hypothetical protein GCM10025859_15860 [Alicyclobacillus fastidiosus]
MADVRWLLIIAFILVGSEELIYRRLSLWRVSYRRYFAQPVIRAGESVEMVEVIENRKFLPVPRVVLEAAFDASMHFRAETDAFLNRSDKFLTSRSIFSLSPYTRITRRHQIRCDRRGIYKLNSAAITAGGVFGGSVFKHWECTGPDTELMVYPQLVPNEDLLLSSLSLQGDAIVRRFVSPDPFMRQGARPYQFGDSLNQVNWKVTARTGSLHVHLQEFTTDYYVKVLLNFVIDEGMWQQISEPVRIEAGISLAATLADELIAAGLAVGFYCNGVHSDEYTEGLQPENGPHQLADLWSHLAGLQLKVRCDFNALLRSEAELAIRKTDFVLITGYVDEEMRDIIQSLEDEGHSVSIISLPSEAQASAWLNWDDHPEVKEAHAHGEKPT